MISKQTVKAYFILFVIIVAYSIVTALLQKDQTPEIEVEVFSPEQKEHLQKGLDENRFKIDSIQDESLRKQKEATEAFEKKMDSLSETVLRKNP